MITPELIYLNFLRYIMFAVAILFFSKAYGNIIDYKLNKLIGAMNTSLMCFFTGAYCLSIFFTTLPLTHGFADNIMPINFICGFTAYYFYCETIEDYLGLNSKLFYIGKFLIIITIFFHIINFANVFVSGFPLLTETMIVAPNNLYYIVCGLSHVPNTWGIIIGCIGGAGIVLTAITIMKHLRKVQKKEQLLFLGIIITLIVSINDTVLGMGFIQYGFPLYFLGNAFEAIRFSHIFKVKTLRKLNILEATLSEVSKIAQVGTIAGSISHDIKNPLAVVLGELMILEKFHKDDSLSSLDVTKSFSSIKDAATRIDQFLECYTTLLGGVSKLEKSNFSLKDIINESIKLLNHRIEEFDISIDTKKVNNIYLLGVETEILLVVMNLLNNSIDAIGYLDDRWIKFNLHNKSNRTILEVQDSGMRISDEIAEKIFSPHFSTKGSQSGLGLGLGLMVDVLKKNNHNIYLDKNAYNTKFVIQFSD